MRFAPGYMVAALLIAASTLASAQDRLPRTPAGGVKPQEPGLYDLGFVLAGTRVSAEVSVDNPLDAEIRYIGLEGQHPSAEVIMSPATIGAHGSAKAVIRLDAAEFARAARLEIGLLFESHAGRTRVAVPLWARLESAFACDPAALEFGTGPLGERRSMSLTIAPISREEAEFSEIVAPPEVRLTRTPGRIIEGRRAAIFDVEFVAPARLGAYESQIRFKLKEGERIAWLAIPVRAHVQSDVAVEPSSIALGRLVRGRDVLSAEFEVKALGDRPITVVQCDCTGPFVASVSGARIKVTPEPTVKAGPIAGSVRVCIDRQWEPVVRVSIQGEIRDPYVAVPDAIYLDGGAAAFSAAGATVELYAEPGFPLDIAALDSDLPYVQAEAAVRPGCTSIMVRLKPGMRTPATFNGVLRIRTRSAVEPEIVVPIAGRGGTAAVVGVVKHG